jgi:hypothetical protein
MLGVFWCSGHKQKGKLFNDLRVLWCCGGAVAEMLAFKKCTRPCKKPKHPTDQKTLTPLSKNMYIST